MPFPLVHNELQAAYRLVWAGFWENGFHRRIILGLFGINLALIGLPILLELAERLSLLTPRSRPFLHPTNDGSIQELGNYVQAGLCVIFLALVVWKRHSIMALAWCFIFLFVLIDDALQYHETVGAWLATTFHFPSLGGMRPVDLGELLAWSMAGLVVGPMLTVAFLRSSGVERGMGLILMACFGALVVCAVGLDMLHVAVPSELLMVAEDGGEMIAIALACSVSLLWAGTLVVEPSAAPRQSFY